MTAATQAVTRVQRATSPSIVRQIALQYARDTRHHPFTRVSQEFLDEIETTTRRAIRLRVDWNPSKGKTLT